QQALTGTGSRSGSTCGHADVVEGSADLFVIVPARDVQHRYIYLLEFCLVTQWFPVLVELGVLEIIAPVLVAMSCLLIHGQERKMLVYLCPVHGFHELVDAPTDIVQPAEMHGGVQTGRRLDKRVGRRYANNHSSQVRRLMEGSQPLDA